MWLAFQPRRILGYCGDATVSPRGLLRPTPMVELSDVLLINFIKINMFISLMNLYIYVYVCVYDDFIALVVSGIVLARQCQGEVRPAQKIVFFF